MNRLLSTILCLFLALNVFATHNRAGEITYRQISQLTYEITVTTFTYTLSQADRPELEILWGDNTSSIVPRANGDGLYLPNYYKMNVYVDTHTYPGPGIYQIVMMDQNRNDAVLNIPGSVNVPFTIKTTLMIDPQIGHNNTPILYNPPIDRAAIGKIFIHNPAAHDPDGDSLSYKLAVCLGFNADEIANYELPYATDSIVVNEITGDLIWSKPAIKGKYNVAILIEEWRDNVKIGQILRDMQIEVYDSENHPPKIDSLENLCVLAGDSVQFNVNATDQDFDIVHLSVWGGPMVLPNQPANFVETDYGPGFAKGLFTWITDCSHIRVQPYTIVFKAQDDNSNLDLVDLKNVRIRVVCPAPEITNIVPTNSTISLLWKKSICGNISGYKVYRRTGPYDFVPDDCELGIPEYTGYEYIGSTEDTLFTDNNGGAGLRQGYNYCYRIICYFEDGSESYASNEICSELIRGIPLITKVSISKTDNFSGTVDVEWSKPVEFDTVNAAGPYKYLVYRSSGFWGNNLILIDSLESIDDTIFHDSGVNTKDTSVSYRVEFWNTGSQGRFLIGAPQVASSVFISIQQGDNRNRIDFSMNVPWINTSYDVFRWEDTSYVYIGSTPHETYIDDGLRNGKEYCYYVKSNGGYDIVNVVDPIINLSQENCATPIDTEPPCPPDFTVVSDCDSLMQNRISWTLQDNECSEDIIMYRIAYAMNLKEEPKVIDSLIGRSSSVYFHKPETTVAGCYQVTAVDSFYNEATTQKVCVDYCPYYTLPDIFTPNGDGHNDIYHPGPYYFVEKVDMKIFNRWGTLLYETTDPDINWDGKIMGTNTVVSDGVYFFICDVYEYRLSGVEPRTITGFIQVIGDMYKPKQ